MSSPRLSARQIFAFALPAVPISALGLPLVVYVPPFYGSEMGLGLTVVGTIFTIARVWDIITDPILGAVSDKFVTPMGRRRHWIVLSVPILMVSSYAVFFPSAPVTAVYLMGWMVVLYLGYTLLSISHMSWGAELTDDYNDRARIQGWREFALIFGMLAVLVLPAIVQQVQGGEKTAQVGAMGWFILLTLPLLVGVSVTQVSERPVQPQPSLGFAQSVRLVSSNRLLQRVLFANLMTGLAIGITGSLYIFFISDVMALPDWSNTVLLLYFVASLLGVPGWIWLSCRIGKHQAFRVAMVWLCLSLPLLLLVPAGNLWGNIVVNSLYGLMGAASPFLLRSILADVTDWDNLQSGAQRTGLYYALLMMTNKFGYAIAVGLTYPLLDGLGYVPEAENAAATLLGVKLLFIIAPVLAAVLAAIALWNFPLDATAQRDIRQQLTKRDAEIATARSQSGTAK